MLNEYLERLLRLANIFRLAGDHARADACMERMREVAKNAD
jgi:hypothetical protein